MTTMTPGESHPPPASETEHGARTALESYADALQRYVELLASAESGRRFTRRQRKQLASARNESVRQAPSAAEAFAAAGLAFRPPSLPPIDDIGGSVAAARTPDGDAYAELINAIAVA